MDKLTGLRNKIDKIDQDIIKLLDQRMEIVSEVKSFKRENNIPVLNENREKEVKENIKKYSQNEIDYFPIYEKIMEVSRNYQND